MANFVRTRADWSSGGNVTPAELAALDAKQQAGVNAYGGTWAPASALTINGLKVTTTLDVRYGGTVTLASGVTFELSGYPALGTSHTGRTRTVVTPFSEARTQRDEVLTRDPETPTGVTPLFSTIDGERLRLVLPIRAIDGATITGATIFLRTGSLLPTVAPRARLVRVDGDGVVTALSAGWVAMAVPLTLDEWGDVTSWTVPCTATTVNVATGWYAIEVEVEEVDAPETKAYVIPIFTADVDITSTGVLATDALVLLTAQTDASENGLRYYKPTLTPKFVPWNLVGLPWYPTKSVALTDGVSLYQWTDTLYAAVPFRTGALSTWLSATATFTGVADMRPA